MFTNPGSVGCIKSVTSEQTDLKTKRRCDGCYYGLCSSNGLL
jgi:hypothetical protein